MNFKKGDRVEVIYKGNVVYGVVKRGNRGKIANNTNIIVVIDGGIHKIKGHPIAFRYSDKPLPKDPPNLMDKWSVKGYKTFEGREGYGCEAYIYLNGKKVIYYFNSGNGGCGNYESTIGNRNIIQRFEKDAKEWTKLFSNKDHFEEGDSWIIWYVEQRPYGVTAKKYWEEFDKPYTLTLKG